MGPIQTYKLLYSKGNHKQSENKVLEWEKIFANNIPSKDPMSRIYKELLQFNNKKREKKGQLNSF